MALLFERGSGTAINFDSVVPKPSQTNGTAARKFSAPEDPNVNTQDVTIKSNDEHLVEQAASIKGVASMAESVATTARAAILSTRSQLTRVLGAEDSDARPVFAGVTEADVAAQRDIQAVDLASKFTPGLVNVKGVAQDMHKLLPDSVFQVRSRHIAPPANNSIIPDITSVAVEMDRKKGTVDCFYARVTLAIPEQQVRVGRAKVIRIFRATSINPVFQRGHPVLSMHGIDRLTTSRNRTRTKNQDTRSITERALREDGILNAVGLLTPVDPSTNLRTAAASKFLVTQVPSSVPPALSSLSPTAVAAQSFVNAPRLDSLDPSVASDLNVLRNIRLQDPAVAAISLPVSVVINAANMKKSGLLNVSQDPALNTRRSSVVVDKNNNQEFREIATLTLEKLKARKVGSVLEYDFLDDHVGFGKGYRYYATTVDADMVESIRSKVVEVVIEGIRVPEMPRSVTTRNVQSAVSLAIQVDDLLVEKFEIFRKEANAAQIKKNVVSASVISGPRGFNVDVLQSFRLENNFIKIGESLNTTASAGSTFYDRSVVPGQKYLYRIFSVDVFGNKSERPFEVDAFVPDMFSRPNELLKPYITAEVDAETNKVRLTFKCGDSRVSGLFLSRRDLTLGQSAFTVPSGGASHIRLGAPKGAEGPVSMELETLRGENKDISWTGYFENDTQQTVFVDLTAQLDHTYQYKIYGVDKYGNRTSDDVTKPLMVIRRPMIDRPVNLTSQVVAGPNDTVGGIQLVWQEGNIAVAAEDYLGNQTVLSDNAVRTLYQIERRKIGEERWIEFPLTPELQFFDASPSVLGSQQPRFRPPTVETNQSYVYRVRAVQTGSFISNYSESTEIFASLPVFVPANFRLRSSDPSVKPAYIALNWDTDPSSGAVDRWEIQRSVVNNIAAAKLNPKNSADFQKLEFFEFRTVHRESSRFRAQIVDAVRDSLVASATASPIFTGQHQFQDMDVSLGNTYFYRIRAISLDGLATAWAYRGMKLTDESFEKKISDLVSPEIHLLLSQNMVPLTLAGINPSAGALNSFGFQPGFTLPSIAEVDVGGGTSKGNPGGGVVPDTFAQPTFQNTVVQALTGFKSK